MMQIAPWIAIFALELARASGLAAKDPLPPSFPEKTYPSFSLMTALTDEIPTRTGCSDPHKVTVSAENGTLSILLYKAGEGEDRARFVGQMDRLRKAPPIIQVLLASARECYRVNTCATPASSPEVFGALTNLPEDAGIWHADVGRPSAILPEPLF